MLNAQDWRPAAAYLYLLHLNGSPLAWEYLRRNADYQRDWQQRNSDADTAQRWGLSRLENPLLDSRDLEPSWHADPDDLTRLTMDRAPTTSPIFNLWAAPGFKRLTHDGNRLLLNNSIGHQQLRFALDESVQQGQPVAYLVRPDNHAPAQYIAIEMQRRTWTDALSPHPTIERPGRNALLHMHCLQAFDGACVGASQRIIASMLFGADAIEQRWDSDGALRNQIRHLLRHAREYSSGGYRRLLAQFTRTE